MLHFGIEITEKINMRPDFQIPESFPNGPGTKPVCASAAVSEAFGLGQLARQFMQTPLRERRVGSLKGRQWTQGGNFLPHFLYKYRHLETDNPEAEAKAGILKRAGDLLVRGRVWIAAANTLNDLHDMRFNVVQSDEPAVINAWIERNQALIQQLPMHQQEAMVRHLRQNRMSAVDIEMYQADHERTMGVFSASQDPRNEPMWAHYAADHHGYCVQLSTMEDGVFLLAEKVIYTDEFPTLTLPRAESEDVKQAYLHKSAAWAYEREWRLVTPKSNYAIQLRPEAVTGVILGARVTEATRSAIAQFNEERAAAGMPRFCVYEAAQHRTRYGMQIVNRTSSRGKSSLTL